MRAGSRALASLAALFCANCADRSNVSADALSNAAGERAYQRCYACHALSHEEAGPEGPALGGVVGRRVASIPDFPYSSAMRAYAKAGTRWTRARLDAFLADPQAEVPGNRMGFFGIADPAERAALIDWLERRPARAR